MNDPLFWLAVAMPIVGFVMAVATAAFAPAVDRILDGWADRRDARRAAKSPAE